MNIFDSRNVLFLSMFDSGWSAPRRENSGIAGGWAGRFSKWVEDAGAINEQVIQLRVLTKLRHWVVIFIFYFLKLSLMSKFRSTHISPI